jgi:hypothetical protein
VVDAVVGDVLADALLTAAAKRDQCRVADELVGERELPALELVTLDPDRKRRELIPGAHARRD